MKVRVLMVLIGVLMYKIFIKKNISLDLNLTICPNIAIEEGFPTLSSPFAF